MESPRIKKTVVGQIKLYTHFWCFFSILKIFGSIKLELPGNCLAGNYYEPGLLSCQPCPANASLVTSADGFHCTCDDHSVPVGISRCKPCNATEVISTDGRTCVPRRCQYSSGRFACRKCPSDYISVTQNMDGSASKEVQCVKCARGFRPENNVCVRCEACTCTKQQIIVRGICVPKTFVNSRPKYEENILHPSALLDIVKHEYLCTQNDVRACRTLASECVKNFYSIDPAGPCRFWLKTNTSKPKGLPPLTVEPTLSDKYPGEINLPRGKDILTIAAAVHTSDGKLIFLNGTGQQSSRCHIPVTIRIGYEFTNECSINVSSKLKDDNDVTVSPYLYIEENVIQIPVYPRKPNGYNVQKGAWLSNKFKRYFIMDRPLSTTSTTTKTVYLQTILINIQVRRDKSSQGSLKVYTSIEGNYATTRSDMAITTLKVIHVMPEAGVHWGLEIWGGVLGCLSILYALIKWRGVVRRGGLYFSAVPLLASSISDTLYFATLFSTLHALAAEAGTIGITLPLSSSEEKIIKTFIYSSVALKALKVAWFNFNQCRCDIFFLDWSEYNQPFKDSCTMEKLGNWRTLTLAREWIRMQTIRRVSPDYTVTLALIIFRILNPWQSYLPQSFGYKWAVGTIAWWLSYSVLLLARCVVDRLISSPAKLFPKICTSVGLSLLVFEEDYYAHYVHGRNDDTKDLRSMAGPLASCRVVCAAQLRIVYKQLAHSTPGVGETETRQALLSRFLVAFFERALDGLSWVASERTVLERLLDVELTTRETGNTSTLLYDPEESTPSCFAVTWWGEEWTLSTFDAMLFGCVLIATNDILLAALVTLIIWQIMKLLRICFGNKNQKEKTVIEF